MESIPVFRAADAAGSYFDSRVLSLAADSRVRTRAHISFSLPLETVNGSGKARLHPTDHLVLLGTGTKFLTQVKPKSTIMFGKPLGFASAEIEEVVSDTEIK